MTAQTGTDHREDIIARNLAAVEQHFHNETAETIDKAKAMYEWALWINPGYELALKNLTFCK